LITSAYASTASNLLALVNASGSRSSANGEQIGDVVERKLQIQAAVSKEMVRLRLRDVGKDY